MLRIWQFITILLASLLMATAFGHLLEMPMKIRASGELWLTYQHTLYAWFAIVGGPIEIATILSSAALAYRVRHSPSAFRPTLMAAIIFAFAFFGIWLGLINPVNSRTASWTVDTIPPDWQRWRAQWEYSHGARFVLQFVALALLVKSFPNAISEDRKPSDR
jgi:hypothetical protein